VTLSVGKWREDELSGVQADLGVTDGEPGSKASWPALNPIFPLSAVSSTPKGGLYWALYRDEAEGERAYWEERPGGRALETLCQGDDGHGSLDC